MQSRTATRDGKTYQMDIANIRWTAITSTQDNSSNGGILH